MPNHHQGTDEERHTLDTYVKLSRALATIDADIHRPLADHGLTSSRFGILEALMHLGPLNQRQLGQKILRSSGNVTVVIDHLERAGLVARSRTNDRRQVLIALTDAGRYAIEAAYPEHVARIMRAFTPLNHQQQTTLATLAKQLGTRQEKPA